jgi:hypothetical protein
VPQAKDLRLQDFDMTDRILTPIIALGLAFLVWMYTRSRDQESIDNWPIPVEIDVNSSQAASYEPPETVGAREVKVSFIGPPSGIRELRNMLRRGEVRLIKTITVPPDRENEPKYEDSLRIEPSQIPVPPGVAPVLLENQKSIAFTLWRIMEKQLPVRLRHEYGERAEQQILEPSTVLVRGRQDDLRKVDQVFTQPLVVEGKPATQPVAVEEHVPVVAELSGRPVRVTPSVITVRFVLKPRQSLKELTEVPVYFLCPPNFAFRPEFVNERAGKITVRVVGPATEDRPTITAYVDLTVRKFGAGLHAEEPLQFKLPPGFQLVGDPPRLSSFRLVPLDGPLKNGEAPPGG